MEECPFVRTEFLNRYRCPNCGYLTPEIELPPARIHHACGLSWLKPPRSEGLGDTLAWLIKALTFGRITPCNACNSRRAWLNKLIPYGQPLAWWLRRLKLIRQPRKE